jgi:hypothetical protein
MIRGRGGGTNGVAVGVGVGVWPHAIAEKAINGITVPMSELI